SSLPPRLTFYQYNDNRHLHSFPTRRSSGLAEQTRFDSDQVKALLSEGEGQPALADTWAFFNRILGWRPTQVAGAPDGAPVPDELDRKSTRLNSSHVTTSYAVCCLKQKKK